MKYSGGIIGKNIDQSQTIKLVGSFLYSNVGGSVNNVITFANSVTADLEEDDFVIVMHCLPTSTLATLNVITTGYTTLRTDYVNGTTYDTNFFVSYKRMGKTPDSNVILSSSGSTNQGTLSGVYIFRNVDTNSPFDVTSTTANATYVAPNPSAITPVTRNALIFVAATSAFTGTSLYTSTDLEGFRTVNLSETTSDGILGAGFTKWTTGAFDPGIFGGTANATSGSHSSITIALRPQGVRGMVRNEDIYNSRLLA